MSFMDEVHKAVEADSLRASAEEAAVRVREEKVRETQVALSRLGSELSRNCRENNAPLSAIISTSFKTGFFFGGTRTIIKTVTEGWFLEELFLTTDGEFRSLSLKPVYSSEGFLRHYSSGSYSGPADAIADFTRKKGYFKTIEGSSPVDITTGGPFSEDPDLKPSITSVGVSGGVLKPMYSSAPLSQHLAAIWSRLYVQTK